jgi:hypothetical protein
VLWGVERFLDEHLWLGEDGHLGSLLVQWAGIGLAVAGVALVVVTRRRWAEWLRAGAPGGREEDESESPPVEVVAPTELDEASPRGAGAP